MAKDEKLLLPALVRAMVGKPLPAVGARAGEGMC